MKVKIYLKYYLQDISIGNIIGYICTVLLVIILFITFSCKNESPADNYVYPSMKVDTVKHE